MRWVRARGSSLRRAGFPGQPEVSVGERVPPVVVPQVDSRDTGQPQPTKILFRRRLPVEGAQRAPE